MQGVFKKYKKSSFFSKGFVEVLKDISLNVYTGEHLGIIGESGAGKSTLCRIMSFLEMPDKGNVFLDNIKVRRGNIKTVRGKVGMVFQDPSTSLDPKMTVRATLKEALKNSNGDEISEHLQKVGLSMELLDRYPNQLSGGQQQRVAIARVLISGARYVIFDEFTSALDVSTQARIVNLLSDINRDRDYSFIFVSHDVKLIGFLSDRIYVIYKGKIVEELESLIDALHPYTKALIENRLQERVSVGLDSGGCSFYGFCPYRFSRCSKEIPELRKVGKNKKVRCFLYD